MAAFKSTIQGQVVRRPDRAVVDTLFAFALAVQQGEKRALAALPAAVALLLPAVTLGQWIAGEPVIWFPNAAILMLASFGLARWARRIWSPAS